MTAAVRRAERLALAVTGRAGHAPEERRVAERALALVVMVEVSRPHDARPTAAGLLELVELAREAPPTWEAVRDDWRALCGAARAAREGAHWGQALSVLESLGERELARVFGVELAGTGVP